MRRIKQFIKSFFVKIKPIDYNLLNKYLNQKERELFFKLAKRDQRHSFDTIWKLINRGYDEKDLLKFALLHDIGKKEGRINLFNRISYVILERLWPEYIVKLNIDSKRKSFKNGLYCLKNHPRIGADLLAEIGEDQEIIEWVKEHHNLEAIKMNKNLKSLREADDKS